MPFSCDYKPPTPEEISVINTIYSVVVVCVFVAGLYLIYLSFGQPPEKADLAIKARWFGSALVLGSIVIKFRWLLDALPWLDQMRKRWWP